MFFQNYKKKGQVLGKETQSFLKMSFGPKFYDDPNFELPKALFKDVYIDGFLTKFLQMNLMMSQKNKMWSTQNITDFTLEFYNSVDPSGTYASQTLQNQRASNMDKLSKDDNYKNGIKTGSALVIVLNDLIEEYINHDEIGEILKKASDVATKLASDVPLDESLSVEENLKGTLVTAVISITLRKYIKDNWAY